MSKHTPGPWTACMETFAGRPSGFHIAASPHGSTRPICETGPRAEFEPSELEANARLIAAAPTLVAALEGLMEAVPTQTNDRDWWPDELTRAMAAARKALDEAGTEP